METNLLGKQVLPLPIPRNQISGSNADRSDAGEWLTGDERREYYKSVVDHFQMEYDEESINQKWYVFTVRADGNYDLRSEYGYQRINASRDDFEVIKDGDTWNS